jgi:hypothetical protein
MCLCSQQAINALYWDMQLGPVLGAAVPMRPPRCDTQLGGSHTVEICALSTPWIPLMQRAQGAGTQQTDWTSKRTLRLGGVNQQRRDAASRQCLGHGPQGGFQKVGGAVPSAGCLGVQTLVLPRSSSSSAGSNNSHSETQNRA